MRTELKISDIKTVYEGSMAEGEIDNTNKKRYSDALVYFYRGKVEYIFGDKRLIAEGGTVIYLPKGSSYYMIIAEHSDYIVVDFDFEDTADDCGILFTSLSPRVKGDFEKLFRTGHSREAWSYCDSFSLLYGILSSLIASKSRVYSKSGELYSSAVKYILESYARDDLRSSDIADSVGITEVHLRRIFKLRAGTSPMHYVNYLRIEKAKNMLIESNIPIAKIALLSGFSDPYYFSREFKKRVGIAPSVYKKQRIIAG